MFACFKSLFLYVVLALAQINYVAGLSTGSTVNVNGIFYFVPSIPVATISNHGGKAAATFDQELVPITFIANASNPFTTSDLETLVANFTSQDDVFNTGFLQGRSSENDIWKEES